MYILLRGVREHLQVFLHIQNNKSFLCLSGEDMTKSDCAEKDKQATFLTEAIKSDEKYIMCTWFKFLIWTIEG